MNFVDIAYSSESTDQQRQFDLYLPTDNPPDAGNLPPLVVFIHGGAWRSEDKADHRKLARNLTSATQLPVAVPNYRLTPRSPPDEDHFRHPGHCEDTLQALTFLRQWQGPSNSGPLYNPDQIHLIGHSCSAHMITSIFLDSSPVTPSLTPPQSLLSSVKTVTMSEGIYDLDLLVNTFPDYRPWFVVPAFGQRDSFAAFSTANFPLLSHHIKWLVIHSKNDSLINVPQSELMYQHLCQLNGDDASAKVFCNIDQLDDEHDDVLLDFKYIDIVKNFIMGNI